MKYLSLQIAALAVLFTLFCSVAFATGSLDLSYFRENSTIFDISADSERDIAFITTTLTSADRSFTHDREHDQYYSTFESDILVHDYLSSNPYGVLRIWINYMATEFLNINSVTFQIDGKDYTFTGCCEKDWKISLDKGGVEEQALIVIGSSNADFIAKIAEPACKCFSDTEEYVPIPVILHGTRDVKITMDKGAAEDLVVMALAVVNNSGYQIVDAGEGTKLTVTTSK